MKISTDVLSSALCISLILKGVVSDGRPGAQSRRYLWVLWSRIPAATSMRERHIKDHLLRARQFGDPATLRRTIISCGLLFRKPDGTDYCRIEQVPPPEAKALIRLLADRRRARPGCERGHADA